MKRNSGDRVAKHRQRMKASGYRNVALMLPGDSVIALDKLCKDSGQSRAVMLERLIEQATTPLQKAVSNPPTQTVTCNGAPTKSPATKPAAPAKPAPKKRGRKSAATTPTDAIGLARPEGFKDFAGAISIESEIKNLPTRDSAGNRALDWRDLHDKRLVTVRHATELVAKFKADHRHATINQRYLTDDKTIMELVAVYSDDDDSDHRIKLQARRAPRS